MPNPRGQPTQLYTRGLWLAALAAGFVVLIRAHQFFAIDQGRYRVEAAAAWFAILIAACIGGQLFQRSGRVESPAASERLHPLVMLVLALGIFTIFWPALDVGLLSDDFVLLPSGQLCGPRNWPFFRPMPLALWGLIDRLLPPNVVASALHALNLVIHSVNAVLVACVARRLGLNTNSALCASLVFGLFPAIAEPVVWASGIQDLLLVLGALLFTLGLVENRAIQTIVGLAIALTSKEAAVMVPAAASCLALRTSGAWRHRERLLAFALVACAAFAAWRLFQLNPGSISLAPTDRYQLKELLFRPFGALAMPWTRAEISGHPLLASSSVAAMLGLLLIAAFRSREDSQAARVLLGTPLWIVLAAVPVGKLFYVGPDLEGAR